MPPEFTTVNFYNYEIAIQGIPEYCRSLHRALDVLIELDFTVCQVDFDVLTVAMTQHSTDRFQFTFGVIIHNLRL